MTDKQPATDPSTVVPLAAPLTGESAEPDHPAPHEVLPMGDALEVDNLVADDE